MFDISVSDRFSDETVKELEGLKNALKSLNENVKNGDEIQFRKSQAAVFSDIQGSKTAHEEISSEVNKNGKLYTKVSQKIDVVKNNNSAPKSVIETKVEIPSEHIYQVTKNKENLPEAQRKRDQNWINKSNIFSKIKYSPMDMAEYIFWTGDEKGVALTIEEFLGEGLMTREEAINFLQSIKFNLDLMQIHYQGLGKMNEKIFNKEIHTRKSRPAGNEKMNDNYIRTLYQE